MSDTKDTNVDTFNDLPSDEDEQIIPKLESLRWKCETCNEMTPLGQCTSGYYMTFRKNHPATAGCEVVMIDEDGNTVASSLGDAQHKGILPKPGKGGKNSKSTRSGKLESNAIPKDNQPLYTGFFKTEKVELDPVLFLYRQAFIQKGIVPSDISMGDFITGSIESLMEACGLQFGLISTQQGEN